MTNAKKLKQQALLKLKNKLESSKTHRLQGKQL